MSEHQNDDKEDLLETLERVAEEHGMHEEDDDSFDAEAVLLARGESLTTDNSTRETGDYYNRNESMGTEASEYVMGDDSEYGYARSGSFDDSQSTDDRAFMPYARRGSQSSRRSSYVSTDSAATSVSGNSSRASPSIEQQRSSSIGRPRRRQSIKLTSFRSGDSLSDDLQSESTASPSLMKTIRPLSRLSKLAPSARRVERPAPAEPHSAFMSVGQMGNTQLDDTAAAAAIVAMTEGAVPSKRIQFVVDDVVLVFLNILNHTNSVDPPEAFTVLPVNKFGFPPGEGHCTAEQQGPYVYVMATVKRVHFDEDVPYYTVMRADTLAEQRADVGKFWRVGVMCS